MGTAASALCPLTTALHCTGSRASRQKRSREQERGANRLEGEKERDRIAIERSERVYERYQWRRCDCASGTKAHSARQSRQVGLGRRHTRALSIIARPAAAAAAAGVTCHAARASQRPSYLLRTVPPMSSGGDSTSVDMALFYMDV